MFISKARRTVNRIIFIAFIAFLFLVADQGVEHFSRMGEAVSHLSSLSGN